MPVSYNSPARNFFLLASTGQQEITAFIKRITTPSSSDTFGYEPARIEYVESDQKYLVSGTQIDGQDSQLAEGYLVKTTENDTRDFDLKIQSTISATDYGTTIRSIAQDSNENIIICGRKGIPASGTAGAPYVGKFDLNGNSIWFASTTEDALNNRIEYTDIAIDSNDNIYVIGYDSTNGTDGTFISRYTSAGAIVWSVKVQDTGSDGFVDIRGLSISVNDRDELVIAGSLEGITREKGFVGKYSLDGDQIWIKTFEDKELATNSSYRQVVFNSAHVDGNGYIYCAGYSEDAIALDYRAVVLRLDPFGNIVWQNKTNYSNSITYTSVSADTLTGQTIVAGEVWTGSEGFTITQRFNAAGNLSWTRKLSSTNARSAYVNITSDPSYYYITYADETQSATDPESFLYGKLSITGNGLGSFVYDDGVLDQDYVVTTIPVKTGTLFDGSIRNDNSDFITYPYSATKVLFDDLTMIYQPKQPVHDGSDHDITNENVLSEPSSTITAATDTTVIDTTTFYDVVVAPNGTGTGVQGGFAVGDHLRFGSGSQTFNNKRWEPSSATNNTSQSPIMEETSARMITTNSLDLRRRVDLTFSVIKGSSSNGGETPDANEDFRWYYSIDDKQTWTEIGIVVAYNTTAFDTLSSVTVTLPVAARTADTYLRIGQKASSGQQYDHWGLTQIVFEQNTITDSEPPFISADGIVYGSNLILNYDFNNLATYPGTGTTVNNLSSSSNTGTLVGTTLPSFNPAGYFEFDGVGRIETTLDAATIGSTFTAEAWIYPTDFSQPGTESDSYPRRIMSCNESVGSTKWCIGIDTSGRLGFGGSGGVEEANDKKYQLSLNTYYHVVLTHNGTSYKIYVNGTEEVDQTNSPIGSTSQSTLAIGGRPDGQTDRVFGGRIAESRINTNILTATEVSQNFNATRGKYGV
jgi:hypothetical protein